MSLDIYLKADTCPHCGRGEDVFSANITHNLNKMAEEAGVYGIVWRPEENGIFVARQLVEPLRKAIEDMKADPQRFKRHNPDNGWGTYAGLLSWLEQYLEACVAFPDATVRASR